MLSGMVMALGGLPCFSIVGSLEVAVKCSVVAVLLQCLFGSLAAVSFSCLAV